MTPNRRIIAASVRIVVDARAAACLGHAFGIAGLRGAATPYTGLPRAA